MWSRILTIGVCLVVATGCAKKIAKKPSQSDSAGAAPTASDRDKKDKKGDKDAKADEPNWLNDPRYKKDPPGTPADGSSPGKQSWGFAPPQGGWEGPNTGVGPAPGMGLLQPQPVPAPPATGSPTTAGKRAEMADMKDVWIYIENASGAGGRMPTQKMIYEALVAAKSPAAELVRTGVIYLTGATTRESVWAFETEALRQGGLVATQNGVETLSAAELKARLGK